MLNWFKICNKGHIMHEDEIAKIYQKFNHNLTNTKLSRRDAIKLASLSSMAFMLNPTQSHAKEKKKTPSNGSHIVIVGGGAAGCSLANYLANNIDNPKITIIEPNKQSISYQPGQTLIGAGIWDKDDILAQTSKYLPSDIKWIQDSVTEFSPDNNKVRTSKSSEISYDFLVVATGLQLNFNQIKGLSKEMIGTNGIGSIYFANGAVKTWKLMQEFIEKSKNEQVHGVFTHPNTPIKCGGAPKKIMYLTHARLRDAKTRKNATLTFYPNGGKMFGIPEYHEAIVKQFEKRDMKYQYKHNLIEVDIATKKAKFEHHFFIKGDYDPDIEEHTMIPQTKEVVVDYDFLHVTPPMSAPEAVKNSPLAWQRGSASKGGWVELKKETLQHNRYPNVFAIGDVAGIPMGKTGGSIRKQYTVCGNNLISIMSGKEPKSKYDGYTVCPLITDIGSIMMAEFDWSGKPKPSFPLDPTVERWIWWILKVYMLKPMYFYGMLKGRA